MTIEEIRSVFDVVGYYYDPDHPAYVSRNKVDALPVPFVEFELQKKSFGADNVVYYAWDQLVVRLYTDDGSRAAGESTVETALTAAGLFWKREYDFLPELLLWQTVYTMEV